MKRVNRSENALVVTLKLEDDTFSFADPAGQSYAARLEPRRLLKGILAIPWFQ